jgi:hypothetical protein
MINKRLILSLLAILMIAPLAWSKKERALRPVTGTVDSNIRQALVISNSEYRHAGCLRNPVNDARAIGSTLQQLGFDVTLLTDADQRKMERTIREFGDQLRQRKGVGLFYYAGHGMQFDEENYLLPTDINPSTEEDVRYDAVLLGKLLAQMRAADNAMNVVILDACRNNPFSRSFRTFNPGLAQINAAAGTFISFATAPGQVAADGNRNAGNGDVFVVKYSSGGEQQWARQLGSSTEDYGQGTAVDSAGNVYVTGTTEGDLGGNRNAGLTDVFVLKLSP